MLRIAVIGAGHWGPNLIRHFHAGSGGASTVSHVVDTRTPRLETLAAQHADIHFGTDVREPMTDASVDAIVVTTPTSTHFELVRKALEAGKHVLVEKPLCLTVREGEKLKAFAQKQDRVLMVGHVFLFNPAVQHVHQLIKTNALGTLKYLSMVRTNLGPIRDDVNAAYDLASHDISIADLWLGASALSVSAVGASVIKPGVHDAVFATLRYPGDVLVKLDCNWLGPRKVRDITVVGETRIVFFDDLDAAQPITVTPGPLEGHPAVFAKTEPLRAECQHFIDCIEHGQEPLTNVDRALSVVRTLEGITQSLERKGAEVSL